MKIAMVGTGYVGLVTGACFAEFGFTVTCIDKDIQKIENLKKNIIPIYEPGLESLVSQTARLSHLSFTTDLEEGMKDAAAVFIAVGTPTLPGGERADLTYVLQAARETAEQIRNYTVIVTKSTVPVGTSKKVTEEILKTRPDLTLGVDFDVASNPEFLREGSAINDFMRPDRVVIGTNSKKAEMVLKKLYRPLYLIETPIVSTSIETAELIKYAANAFLATKIAFINEIANICEQVNADVQEVSKAVGLDGRIGKKFLHAGPGYGGSCFPKDTLALIQTAQDLGTPTTIVEAVAKSNKERKIRMAEKVAKALGASLNEPNALKDKKIAILGLTFKPNTDDMRDAPSLDILPLLQNAGATLQVYDPVGMEESRKFFNNLTYCKNTQEACQDVEAIVILTEWNEFRGLDFYGLKKIVKTPLLIDFRNIYKAPEIAASGFDMISIGRPFAKALEGAEELVA
ncbi:MAG TPA: UDP-glucose/GDP-mannose dehydrogenase family protein [Alphaproteobacteria bacterium]|nr:UDP-glucose/GDP-mannose dehydrogenase family protein [Alphaproteobacteria bacterium]